MTLEKIFGKLKILGDSLGEDLNIHFWHDGSGYIQTWDECMKMEDGQNLIEFTSTNQLYKMLKTINKN